ncbi:hypothetical protein [Microbacterium aerolatum]|uniref:hypothetical protein n=1 Tax=Microbacterium aerolatum TaxID=153731 RepID=UPI00384FA9EA
MTRRTVFTLGAALGFTGVVAPTAAWSWSPSRSMLGTGDGTDPSWVWDDDLDRIMANVVTSGQVPAVNTAIGNWVNNNDPLPAGLPAELTAFLQQSTQLPAWADMNKLRLAADFNRRRDLYRDHPDQQHGHPRHLPQHRDLRPQEDEGVGHQDVGS